METIARNSPAIRLVGVRKSFGNFEALKPLTLDVAAGCIHAFVGQNGAGKSTTLGILAGRIPASGGEIEISGAKVELGDPRKARAAGVVAIYQELTIVPALSAVANVFLGQAYSRKGVLSEAAMRQRFYELTSRLGVTISADAEARSLSVADQQTLEILRAIEANARIILFDEPTTALAPPEREALFKVMRDLRAEGHTLIYVSHNLDEVLDISDAVTVFRNGRLIETRAKTNWTKSQLVASMLGEDMGDIYQRRPASQPRGTVEALRVSDCSIPGAIGGISFDIRPGEVLGIGGLVGAGRTSLLRAIAGLEPRATGTMVVDGNPVPWPRSPRAARKLGIALVPEDRKHQGLVLGMTATDNVTLPNFSKVAKRGLMEDRLATSRSSIATRAFGFDSSRLGAPVGTLSGGNQQKVLLARWAYEKPKILMVDEPTRGIDVGAKAEILDSLRAFADQGLAVIIVSSELEEICALADRVIVLSEGRLVDHIDTAQVELTVHLVLNSAFGVERHNHV
ncbi:sugar ABC transporter ATP-binding protein [Rhizobium sp. 16-449-1b]|uniref:sugar ABC transporter ATP-binding protein n=1 Tax=Rhizobium sp. 16-449-1b TaxID=2819989 RepID=UPI001ADC39C1|nr:sugar ABC transporter ATP-binding protein [Rhizobium sp. 16-449-1b]MBO9195908.1 sugar ABC transporter ATP-binding protein [Rhizobium sp. 16-449-1b]